MACWTSHVKNGHMLLCFRPSIHGRKNPQTIFFSIQDSLIPFWSCWHDIDHFCSGGNRKKAASGFHRGNGHNPYHPYPYPHPPRSSSFPTLKSSSPSSPLSRWQLTDFVMTIVPTSFFQVFNSPHWYTIQLSPIWSTYFQFGKALICWKSNTRWQTKTKTTASASIWSGAIWWRLGTGSNHCRKSFFLPPVLLFFFINTSDKYFLSGWSVRRNRGGWTKASMFSSLASFSAPSTGSL